MYRIGSSHLEINIHRLRLIFILAELNILTDRECYRLDICPARIGVRINLLPVVCSSQILGSESWITGGDIIFKFLVCIVMLRVDKHTYLIKASVSCFRQVNSVKLALPVRLAKIFLVFIALLDSIEDNDILYRAFKCKVLYLVCIVMSCIGLGIILEIGVIVVSLYLLDKVCIGIVHINCVRIICCNDRFISGFIISVNIAQSIFVVSVFNVGVYLAVIGQSAFSFKLNRLVVFVKELCLHVVVKLRTLKVCILGSCFYFEYRAQSAVIA